MIFFIVYSFYISKRFIIYKGNRHPNTRNPVSKSTTDNCGFIKKRANVINGKFSNINYRGKVIYNGAAKTQTVPKSAIIRRRSGFIYNLTVRYKI